MVHRILREILRGEMTKERIDVYGEKLAEIAQHCSEREVAADVYKRQALVLGALCGLLLSRLLGPKRSKDNRLILAVAMLLMLSGICAAFDVSPLLSCMVFGATYVNITEDEALFEQVNGFTPPITSMFFVLSGMSLELSALSVAGLVFAVCLLYTSRSLWRSKSKERRKQDDL